jgi:hypothetical protein
MILDYQTADLDDDIISAYSDPVGYTLAAGLGGNELGLAEAIISDFDLYGGQAQLRFQNIQTASREDYGTLTDFTGVFSFDGSVQAIPEPTVGSTLAVAAGLLGLSLARRRRQGFPTQRG